MKKVIVVLAVMLGLIVLFGCGGEQGNTPNLSQKTEGGKIDDPPVVVDPWVLIDIAEGDISVYDFGWDHRVYPLSKCTDSSVHYSKFLLKSEAEKDAWFFPLYELKREHWESMFTHFGVVNHDVLKMESYDDAFFQENNLIRIYCTNGNSIFFPRAIKARGNELSVQIYHTGTNLGAEMFCGFFIPIRKDCFNGEVVNVEFVYVSREEWPIEEWEKLMGWRENNE